MDRKMSLAKNISFSVDRFDADGDKWEDGVYFHFGETSIRVANLNNDDLDALEDRVKCLIQEIKETYLES